MITKHDLYELGLKCYKGKQDIYFKICNAYAEWLCKSNHYEQAAAMYRLSGNLEKALECYKKCENWPMIRSMALLMKWPDAKIKELAEDFANSCRGSDDYKGLSIVMFDMFKANMLDQKAGLEELIEVLVKAREYFKAIELSSEYGRPDLIDGIIFSGIKLAYDILGNDLAKAIEMYQKRRERLEIVQEQKKTMPKIQEEGIISGLDFDMGSESGKSSSSKSSRRSNASQQHKKARIARTNIKEGSRYEEEQIIEYLATLVPTSDTIKDVDYIKKCLDFFGCKEESERLTNLLKDLQTCTSSVILSYEQIKLAETHPNFFEVFPKLKPVIKH